MSHNWLAAFIGSTCSTADPSGRRNTLKEEKPSYPPGHDQGAETWACIASLVETCKLTGVDPQAYLDLTRLVGRQLLGGRVCSNDIIGQLKSHYQPEFGMRRTSLTHPLQIAAAVCSRPTSHLTAAKRSSDPAGSHAWRTLREDTVVMSARAARLRCTTWSGLHPAPTVLVLSHTSVPTAHT